MISVPLTLLVLAVLAFATDRPVDISFAPPLLVDLFAWYIVGAYLGVVPAFGA